MIEDVAEADTKLCHLSCQNLQRFDLNLRPCLVFGTLRKLSCEFWKHILWPIENVEKNLSA